MRCRVRMLGIVPMLDLFGDFGHVRIGFPRFPEDTAVEAGSVGLE